MEAIDGTFIGLTILSMVVLGILVYLDKKMRETEYYSRINSWLEAKKSYSPLVMRIAAGAVLLLSWQADAMMVPELNITAEWIGWYQFILAILLIFRKTTPIAGIGLILLYVLGISEFGFFHMLDYPMYAGAGYYLAVCNAESAKIRGTGLPALYLTVGFSLCWVALEKIIYPQWGLYVLQQNPQLALGFELDFFLMAAAFVEFALGYLLIICLLQRPFALVITFVFFTTTLVFGKLEVIGHTLIHGALIVFLFEGPGRIYNAPITFHKRLGLRIAFTSVNFVLLLALLIVPYTYSAWQQYESAQVADHEHGKVMVDSENIPSLTLSVEQDSLTGWNLQLKTEHFLFTPEHYGSNHRPGEGHAHLYVDGKKKARIYGPWYHLPELSPGLHTLVVTLNTNNHSELVYRGQAISDTVKIDVD